MAVNYPKPSFEDLKLCFGESFVGTGFVAAHPLLTQMLQMEAAVSSAQWLLSSAKWLLLLLQTLAIGAGMSVNGLEGSGPSKTKFWGLGISGAVDKHRA